MKTPGLQPCITPGCTNPALVKGPRRCQQWKRCKGCLQELRQVRALQRMRKWWKAEEGK